MNSDRKLIPLLWCVIAVLLVGAAVGGYVLVRHANEVDQANFELSTSNDSLRRQLQEAKATPTPTPTASPLATPEPTPSPSATPTPTPKATATPQP